MKEIYPQMHAPWNHVVILMMLTESRSLLSCAKSRFLFLVVNYRQISSLQSCVVKIELINNCLFWVGFLPLVFYLQPLLVATKYSKKCLSAKAEMTGSWVGARASFYSLTIHRFEDSQCDKVSSVAPTVGLSSAHLSPVPVAISSDTWRHWCCLEEPSMQQGAGQDPLTPWFSQASHFHYSWSPILQKNKLTERLLRIIRISGMPFSFSF